MTAIEHDPDGPAVLHFPDGIPGFPGERRFTLDAMVEDGAFQLLNSVDTAGVSIVVTRPWVFFPDYAPEIATTDERELGLEAPEDAVLFCAVSIDAAAGRLYVNLRGPFVINRRTHTGRQVVLDDDLPLRATVELEVA